MGYCSRAHRQSPLAGSSDAGGGGGGSGNGLDSLGAVALRDALSSRFGGLVLPVTLGDREMEGVPLRQPVPLATSTPVRASSCWIRTGSTTSLR
jgi:hypothetical protein